MTGKDNRPEDAAELGRQGTSQRRTPVKSITLP
jgi:hypothetical protein